MESELLERVEKWAKESPSRTMLSFVDDRGSVTASLTTGDLYRKTQNLAALLLCTTHQHPKGLGVKPGDRVLLVYPPGLEFIVAFLACLRAGVVAVPVYPPDPRKMKKDISMFVAVAKNSQAKLALTSSMYYHVKKISAIKQKLTFADQLPWPDHLEWNVTDDLVDVKGIEGKLWLSSKDSPAASDVAFLQYTSGSTSVPKGVVLTHGNLNHNLRTISSALQASKETVVVSWLPQYHDMGLIGAYLGTIFNGATGVYMSPFSFIRDPALWLRLVSKYRATHLQAPNFAYSLCARKANRLENETAIDLSSVRHMINGAEPIQGEAIDGFYKAFKRYGLPDGVVKPTYGLAEHTVYVCGSGQQRLWVDKTALEKENQFRVTSDKSIPLKEMIGCGVPSRKDHGIDLRIVNSDTSEECPESQTGEIWISSASKALGYFGQEMQDLSNEVFQARINSGGELSDSTYMKTGDFGVIYQQELFICGRMKDLIIIRGRNHYPQDIEATAESHEELRPGCSAAFSFSDENGDGDEEKLALIAELRDPEIKNKASLCGKIRSVIAREHGVKVTLIVLIKPRSIPKTTSGKISRARCKKALEDKQLDILYRNEDMIGDAPDADEVAELEMDRNVDDNNQGAGGNNQAKPANAGNKDGLPTVIADEAPERVYDYLLAELAQLLNVEQRQVHPNKPLQELGMDSMALTQFQGIISQKYKVHVPEELLYNETTTLKSLHASLCGETNASASAGGDQQRQLIDGGTSGKKQKLFCGCIAYRSLGSSRFRSSAERSDEPNGAESEGHMELCGCCQPSAMPFLNCVGCETLRRVFPMATSGLQNSRKENYGSIPVSDGDDTIGDEEASAKRTLLETLFFTRAAPIYEVIQARDLKIDDLLPLEKPNTTQLCADNLTSQYQKRGHSIWIALLFSYGRLLARCGVGLLFMAGYAVFAPVVLHQVVLGFSSESGKIDLTTLGGWLFVFFCVRILNAFVTTQVNSSINHIMLRLAAALRTMVFQKAMRKRALQLTSGTRSQKSIDINNLITSDATDVLLALTKIHSLWILPLQIGVETFLLYYVLDVAAFAGVAVIILSLLGNYFISKKMAQSYKKWMAIKDQRMKTVKEMLSVIQIVKFNAWESRFKDKLIEERAHELQTLASYSYAGAASTFVLWSSPLLVSTVSFAVYTLMLHEKLTAAKVFTAMALFNALRDPLRELPATIQAFIQSRISIARFDIFFEASEFELSNVIRDSDNFGDAPAVQVSGGQFTWSTSRNSEEPNSSSTLKDIDFTLKKGDFAVVHGRVGAGKSSLCSALLGEMSKVGGQVLVNGRIAYYSQQPWIQNMSIRDNILFGDSFDAARYNAVLDACCLREDLEQFPAGDNTEIGEKGVNLSGGQKARVSLARACYARADVYILDSPLAAVDTVVQKAIFDKCLCGLLANKTVVLVTHNPEIIASKFVTYRIGLSNGVMTEDARVGQPGSRDDFCNPDKVCIEVKALFKTYPVVQGTGVLIQKEERQEGDVSDAVWQQYAKAIGGVRMLVLLLISELLWQFFQISSDFWLSHWTRTTNPEEENADMFIEMYAGLAAAAAVMVLIQGVIVTKMGLQASRYLFESMTEGVLHAPLRFFDTNPIGRAINRYGGDIAIIDKSLPKAIGTYLSSLFASLCALATAGISIRWYFGVLFFVPIVFAYVRLAQGYSRGFCNILRLLKVVLSPLLSHIVQSESGVAVLRAFGPAYVQHSVNENHRLIDIDNALWDTEIVLIQWFAVRLQLLGCGILAVVVGSFFLFSGSLRPSPAMVGLVFSYALSVDTSLMTLTKAWSDAQNDMVSVERVLEYSSLECEGKNGSLAQIEPPSSWPQRGEITFEHVSFNYKPNDSLVLKSISFVIKSHEKVGIVGRTGAGKSSLTMALFRMNELVSGRIFIDGVDIATLPLSVLRSRMSIIPQSPVLLEGSLRNFLDPFDDSEDQEILEMLDHVELLSTLQGYVSPESAASSLIPGGSSPSQEMLSLQLSANGDNWSVGERQMLCMARALLKRSTIVVMDEATASMDHTTERKLSSMIDRELKDVTLLTIAHRLSTVMASDRIMVLQEGQVVEFGTPSALLENDKGVFFGLVQEAKHSK